MTVVMVLIAANVLFSYQGFRDPAFKEKYLFNVDAILGRKEYMRLLSSGFLHANWGHLFWNMLGIYLFGDDLLAWMGTTKFFIIYLLSLLGGDIFSLLAHRNHRDYSSLGASGAVIGVVFAFIALNPTTSLYIILLPGVSFPAWAFGVGYLFISMYGMSSLTSNTGHEAHIGGAIVGILVTIVLKPAHTLGSHPLPILGVLLPAIVFMAILIWKPKWWMRAEVERNAPSTETLEDKYHTERKEKEQELNVLLEKVAKIGYDGLLPHERQRLDELSGK